MRMPADPILPPELAYDDAPPLTDADLERWEAAVMGLADEGAMDDEAAAFQLLEALDQPALLATPSEMDAARSLPQALILVDAAQVEQRRPWRIEDDNAAEWAMRVVASIDADLADLAEKADGWQQRIQHWFRQGRRPLLARRVLLEHHLKDYARRERERDPKRKTVKLPAGSVSSRAGSPQAKVVDEAQVIAWARANLTDDACAEVVKVVESVLVSKLREVVTVGDVVDAYDWEATLACSHVEEGYSLTIEDVPDVAEIRVCDVCAVDPDAPTNQPVASVQVRERTRLAVLDGEGNEVPGAMAEPGATTFSVKASQ